MKPDFDFGIIDVEDKENLVAQIYYDDCQCGEILREDPNEVVVEFYFYEEMANWIMPLDGTIKILKLAKDKLIWIG